MEFWEELCFGGIGMQKKRGQVALFIILGIVLVTGLLFYFYMIEEATEIDTLDYVERVPLQLEPVKSYVDDCLEASAAAATQLLGSQGGLILPVDPYLDSEYAPIAYGYFEGYNRLPPKQLMEQELALETSITLQACTNNFDAFQGVTLESKTPQTRVRILPSKVIFAVDYPVTLIDDASDSSISKFYYELPVRMEHIVEIANSISNELVVNQDYLRVTDHSRFDVQVDYHSYDYDNLLISLTDSQSVIGDTPFTFTFANHIAHNTPPELVVLDEYTLVDDVPFTLQVGVNDDDSEWTFSDDSLLFEIDETGTLEFTPKITGAFVTRIRVTDPHGAYDERAVTFNVASD